jgi:DNA-binding MarR family transcriptional regulator
VKDAPIPFLFFNEIGIIEHLSRTAFERVLPEGLSAAGFAVLNHFVRLDLAQSSPARLARAFQVTKGAMTNTLQRLEALGLVSVDADPADGRGKIVRLTPAGRAARDASIAKVEPLFADLMAQISPAELEAILPVLTRVRIILDAARG